MSFSTDEVRPRPVGPKVTLVSRPIIVGSGSRMKCSVRSTLGNISSVGRTRVAMPLAVSTSMVYAAIGSAFTPSIRSQSVRIQTCRRPSRPPGTACTCSDRM